MATTVKVLRELLASYPDDATVAAYEGEVNGLIIVDKGLIYFIETKDR